MRKTQVMMATIFVLFLSVAGLAAAQSAQPLQSNQSVQTTPNSATGSEPADEALSPQSQDKLVREIRHELIMLPYYGVFDNLAFQLQGRTVILQGQVANSVLKPDAENVVKRVEGVEKVVNNIQVLPPSPMDQRIREQVYRAIYGYGPLFKYANLSIPPIHIIVQSGHVTLEGVVNNPTDKGLCSMRVKQVPSVFSVTNNLRVVKP
jgi:hyperosmotically inducible protein